MDFILLRTTALLRHLFCFSGSLHPGKKMKKLNLVVTVLIKKPKIESKDHLSLSYGTGSLEL